MSFDVKMGKIAKEGNRQQALGTSGEKSEVRGRGSRKERGVGGRGSGVRVRRQKERGRTTWGGVEVRKEEGTGLEWADRGQERKEGGVGMGRGEG